MRQLEVILSEFLGSIEPETGPLTLGEGPGQAKRSTRPTPNAAMMDRLSERLARQVGFNKRIIVMILAIYGVAFAISAGLVIVHHNDIGWIGSLVGGNALGLTGLGSQLVHLWREIAYMDMLLAILPTLTPAEAVRVLESFYLEKLRKPSRKVATKAGV